MKCCQLKGEEVGMEIATRMAAVAAKSDNAAAGRAHCPTF
jgi:hypothetical protein